MAAPRPVCRCDKVTMKIVKTYPSANTAVKATGDHGIPIACRLRQVSNGRYIWRFVDDYDPNESFEGKYNRPVICEDITNNKITFYDTLAKAEKALFLDRGSIGGTMKRGFKVLGRYRFRYAR